MYLYIYMSHSGVYRTVFFEKMIEKKSERLHLKVLSADRA